MADLSTVQKLALLTLAEPPERLVYGLPVVAVCEEHRLIYGGLIVQGVARVSRTADEDVYVLTDAGAQACLEVLRRES